MNGSFDVLHVGHVRCLTEAKQQGDVLIVAVNSDASVRSYKGATRPIMPEDARAELLAALSCVDYVVLFDDINPKAVISEIRPDVHCNGADWGPGCIEREIVESGGGRLHILQWSPGRSTSELLSRIRSLKASPGAFVLFDSLLSSDPLESRSGAELLGRIGTAGMKCILITSGSPSESDCFDKIYTLTENGAVAVAATLERVRDDHSLSLGASWLVSDRMEAIAGGREVNAKTILVGKAAPGEAVLPHFEVPDLASAVEIALG